MQIDRYQICPKARLTDFFDKSFPAEIARSAASAGKKNYQALLPTSLFVWISYGINRDLGRR
jgi:hypothetical protein